MRSSLRVALVAALCVFAIILAVVGFARSHYAYTPPLPIAPPIGAVQDDAVRAARALAVEAPSFDRTSFGPGTKTTAYREPWLAGGGYVTPSGTLYVVVTATSGQSNVDDWSIALLYGGRLTPIRLPHTPNGWGPILFKQPVRSYDAIVEATQHECCDRVFGIRGSSAQELARNTNVPDVASEVLSSGEICKQSDSATEVRLLAISASGRSRLIVDGETLARATRGIVRPGTRVSLGCATFAHRDLITLRGGDVSVIFAMQQGRLSLIARGSVLASGPRHILIDIPEESPSGRTGYVDYLESIAP